MSYSKDGQDEVDASRDNNRRGYHLRPKPRTSADFMGINRSWWTVLLVILLIL